MNKGIPILYPRNTFEWRAWLEENHDRHDSVWLVFYKKSSGRASLTWSESVDVALCFGWIDSKKIKIDDAQSHQFFSKRKPNSTWSKINKLKVEILIEQGLMTDAGLRSVAVAQANGSWNMLDQVEDLVIPDDLQSEFRLNPTAAEFYAGLSKSVKKAMLQWIVLARRPETRIKRIAEIIALANIRQKPKHL